MPYFLIEYSGADTTNACYGGTNALFNSINWLESTAWDGRLAVVVAADIAVYKNGPARPTGGAGAIAILLGPNAPLVFEPGLRVTHIEHAYDFYKPDLNSEYAEVDGPLSNKCYSKGLDIVYNRYMDKLKGDLSDIDYVLFHCPYTKLVQKSFGRLLFNDFRRSPKSEKYVNFPEIYANLPIEDTYANKDMEKEFMARSKQEFESKVHPSLLCAKNMGNMYCGSLYFGLASLISQIDSEELVNSYSKFNYSLTNGF